MHPADSSPKALEKPDRALPSGVLGPPSRHLGLGPDPPVQLCPRARLTTRPANHGHRAFRRFFKATDPSRLLPPAGTLATSQALCLTPPETSLKPQTSPITPVCEDAPCAHRGVRSAGSRPPVCVADLGPWLRTHSPPPPCVTHWPRGPRPP